MQDEIIKILENSNLPLSAKEIAVELRMTDKDIIELERCIIKSLNQMMKFHEVQCMDLSKELALKFYKCKRRMRLFYV